MAKKKAADNLGDSSPTKLASKSKPKPPKSALKTVTKQTTKKSSGKSSTKKSNSKAVAKKSDDVPSGEIDLVLSRGFTVDEIGHVAGSVWQYLSDNGEQNLVDVKEAVDAPNDLVIAAVGWLAREDKLELRNNGHVVMISLR